VEPGDLTLSMALRVDDTLLGGFGNDTLQGADCDDALRGLAVAMITSTGGEGSDIPNLFGRGDVTFDSYRILLTEP